MSLPSEIVPRGHFNYK